MSGSHSKTLNDMILEYIDSEDERIDELIEQELEAERSKYCNWVYDKVGYTPAIEIQIKNKVVPGVYKLNADNKVLPYVLNSDDLYLLPNSEMDTILEEASRFWKRVEIYKQYNFVHKRGILLESSPGMGKTSIITLLVKELVEKHKGVVFVINSINDFTKIYDFLKSTFRRIQPDTPVITIIEDIDKLANSQIAGEILDFLDGKASIEHHLVIMTSNDTSELPDALLRPSRIDRKFCISEIPDDARKEFFTKKGVTELDISKFVDKSKGLSLSEMKELFIGNYISGLPFEEVLDYIVSPYEKQEYTAKGSPNIKISID